MPDPPHEYVVHSGRPARVRVSVPVNGWECPGAINGRILPMDLRAHREDELLRSGRAAIHPLGHGPQDLHADRIPVVLVHGIDGDAQPLQAIANRLARGPTYQLYVCCYNDLDEHTSANGIALGAELRRLRRYHTPTRLGVVAHSMGGIVSRQALNELQLGVERGIERWPRIDLVAIDTPWHGYFGPGDGIMMDMSRPFMPDGAEDMRAASGMFRGDPSHPDPVRRVGLLQPELPGNVRVHLCFATDGDIVEDYTEGDADELLEALVAHYRDHRALGLDDDQLQNLWLAIRSSYGFQRIEGHLERLGRDGSLEPRDIRHFLERELPRFSGDHVTVLRNHQLLQQVADWLSR